LVDSERAAQVDGLLERGAEDEHSTLEQLRRGPTKATAATLLECIVRLDTARGLAVDDVAADVIPPARMRELVRYAETARAHTIGRLREPQRTAVLVAFLATLRPRAEDEVLDVFDALMYKLHSSADQRSMQERHQARRRLDRALRDVVAACAVVLDPEVRDEDLRRRVFCRVPEERLVESWTHVQHETNRREGGELRHFCRRYPYVRSFLPALLDALDLRAIGRGWSVLDAVNYLRRIEGRSRADLSRAPMGHLDSRWRRYAPPPTWHGAITSNPARVSEVSGHRFRERAIRGRIPSESVAGFGRNRWPDSVVIDGRIRPEHAVQAVIDRLREEGARVDDRDAARLLPLIHGHINLVGRYEFDRSLAAPPRGLRPLRA